jgi:hypothetical protein
MRQLKIYKIQISFHQKIFVLQYQNHMPTYADLPDDCKELIAKHMYDHLCHGIPGHYLDMPAQPELYLAGIGNDWIESGDPEMVLYAIDRAITGS